MRTPVVFVAGASLRYASVAALFVEPSLAAGPVTSPKTTFTYAYCEQRGLPLQSGERIVQRLYVADCCPRVEERLLYDPKTRRYRTIAVQTSEQCEPGAGTERTFRSVIINRVPSPPTSPRQETLETRPGWGYGDDNHIHTGPPGQTGDNPGNGPNGNGPPGLQKK
jgi:hypothetical protein